MSSKNILIKRFDYLAFLSLHQGGSDASPFAPNQTSLRQYKDEVNTLEQRNIALQAKTERLERELRVMGDRLRTLETRNKNLEAANREEWVSYVRIT